MLAGAPLVVVEDVAEVPVCSEVLLDGVTGRKVEPFLSG
jgi:hypothetical protein